MRRRSLKRFLYVLAYRDRVGPWFKIGSSVLFALMIGWQVALYVAGPNWWSAGGAVFVALNWRFCYWRWDMVVRSHVLADLIGRRDELLRRFDRLKPRQ